MKIKRSLMEEIRQAKKAARESTGSGNDYVFVSNGWQCAYMGGKEYDDPTGHSWGAGPITIGKLRNYVSDPDADGRVVYIQGRYDSAESFGVYIHYRDEYEPGEYWAVNIGIGNPEGKLGVDVDLLDGNLMLKPEYWRKP